MQPLVGHALEGESSKAIQACNDYLRSGPGRSLKGLLDYYHYHNDQHHHSPKKPTAAHQKPTKTHQNPLKPTNITPQKPTAIEKSPAVGKRLCLESLPASELGLPPLPDKPPTLSLDTLKEWSTRFEWRKRVMTYDLERETEKNAWLQAQRDHCFGLVAERVAVLKHIAQMLEQQIFEQSEPLEAATALSTTTRSAAVLNSSSIEGSPSRRYHNLWLAEERMLGSGETAEVTITYRFNSALISQFRACLKEIAEELGERHYSSDADRILTQISKRLDRSLFSVEQLTRMSQGEHPLLVLLEPYFIQHP